MVEARTGAEARGQKGAPENCNIASLTPIFIYYGRLTSSHRPEQKDSSGNPTNTTFTYNPDDTINTSTDAREAATNYTYGYPDDSSGSQHLPLLTNLDKKPIICSENLFHSFFSCSFG